VFQARLVESMELSIMEHTVTEVGAQEKKLCEGDRSYRKFVRMITNTKKHKLEDYQLRLIQTCLVPSLAGLYGSDFDARRREILEDHQIKRYFSEVFFLSSRRMGKSFTTAMFAIVMAMSRRGDGVRALRFAVFSVNLNSAQDFIKECESALTCIRDTSEFDIKVFSRKIVFINKKNRKDKRIIRTYCGTKNVSIVFLFVFVCVILLLFIRSPASAPVRTQGMSPQGLPAAASVVRVRVLVVAAG
jgi:hypothetical protein